MLKSWTRAVILSAAASLATSGLFAVSTTPAHAAPDTQVSVFSVNVAFPLGTTRAMADVRRMLPTGQIGGFQEFSQPADRSALANYLSSQGWAYYMPSDRAGSDPIAWDTRRFSLVPGSARSVRVHDTVTRVRQVPTSTPVPPVLDPVTGQPLLDPTTGLPQCSDGRPWNTSISGCDPILGTKEVTDTVSPARYVNSVQLTDLQTGKIVGFINTHAIAMGSFDAQYGGKDDKYDQDPTKLDTYNTEFLLQHFEVMTAEMRRMATITNSFVVTGDLNVNFIADQRRRLAGYPTAMFGSFMNFDMAVWQAGGSLLDYMMTLKGGGLSLLNAYLVKGLNTDHPGVVATYATGPSQLFAPGVLRNLPRSRSVSQRRMVLNRVLYAIDGAAPGSVLRIQTRRFNNRELRGAVSRARARGVQVSVKTNRRVRTTLVLAERTAGFSSVSLRTGTPLVRRMPNLRSTLVIASDPSSYAASSRLFFARR